ncbi:hypothetical protein J1N35_003806 [Gossypium stocksii]|uniref:Leucine-rich repeat-containing N-terminal plant-type domain-containing protein n=1 Tax=Gossypium stocksii TaxID=47602 RepID=A0A9D3WB47_9ROSI|nr:hypothetical protein J1N35_003806 [Gossypium stocksii]
MTILDLSNNRLNGKIPHCLGKLSYYLTVSDLWMSNLQWVIPTKFANCESLRILSLNGNQWRDRYHILCLTVKIWKFLMLVTTQLVLALKPKLRFPLSRIMDISHNEFIGSLPTRFFKNLKAMLSVGRNELRDIELTRILTVFTTIDLSNNNFSGKIPSNIGELKSLEELNFSHNNLVGCIPSSIGLLTNPEWLDLFKSTCFLNSAEAVGSDIP